MSDIAGRLDRVERLLLLLADARLDALRVEQNTLGQFIVMGNGEFFEVSPETGRAIIARQSEKTAAYLRQI